MTPKCPGQSPYPSILPTHHSLCPDQPQRSFLLGEKPSDPRLCSESLGDILMLPYLNTKCLFLLVIPYPTMLRALPSAPSSQDRLPPLPVVRRPCIVSALTYSSQPSPAVPCPQVFPLALGSSVALLLCRTGHLASSVCSSPSLLPLIPSASVLVL